MPWKRASGRCGRSPDNRRAASMSPEGSPATTASDSGDRSGCVMSADDATAGDAEEFAHRTNLLGGGRRGLLLGQQRGLGLFQGQAGAVNQLVGGTDAVDLLARETAPLQAF